MGAALAPGTVQGVRHHLCPSTEIWKGAPRFRQTLESEPEADRCPRFLGNNLQKFPGRGGEPSRVTTGNSALNASVPSTGLCGITRRHRLLV